MNVHPVWYNWDGVYDSYLFKTLDQTDSGYQSCYCSVELSYSSTDYQLMSLLFERLIDIGNK